MDSVSSAPTTCMKKDTSGRILKAGRHGLFSCGITDFLKAGDNDGRCYLGAGLFSITNLLSVVEEIATKNKTQ